MKMNAQSERIRVPGHTREGKKMPMDTFFVLVSTLEKGG